MEANLRIIKSIKTINEKIQDSKEETIKIIDKQQDLENEQEKFANELDNIINKQEILTEEQQELKKEISNEIQKIKFDKPRDGKDGRDGKNGLDGENGKDGINGKDGKDGKDGRNGKDGKDGIDGVGINDAKINDKDELIIILTNGRKINVGNVKGKDGVGWAGISVTDAQIENGHLIITLSSGRKIDAGKVRDDEKPFVEEDPIFTNSAAYNISNQDIANWDNKSEFSGSYDDLTDKPAIPTNTSDLNNDSGFITTFTETDPIFSASVASNITNNDIMNWDNKSEFSGDYNDLSNKPANVSDFINDAKYINQLFYAVVLNPDGTINSYSQELDYSTIKSYLTSVTTTVYLDVSQGDLKFYVPLVQDMDINNGPVKFIGIYNKDGNKVLIEFNLYLNNTLTVEITLIESLWNKKTSVVNNLSDNYYPTTNAVNNEFTRKPVLIYDHINKLHVSGTITSGTDSANGLLNQNQGEGTNRNISSWNITGMDLSEFKRIRVVFLRNDITSAITGEFFIPLDAEYIDNGSLNAYVNGASMPYYAVRTRLVGIGCAISSDKTSFTVTQTISLTATTLGMVATTVNDMFVTKIEGYYY